MNKPIIKSVSLLVAAVVSGVPMWYFWHKLVSSELFNSGDIWSMLIGLIWPVLFVCLTFALFGVLGSIIRSKLFIFLAALVVGVEMFFFFGFNLIVLASFLIFIAISFAYMVNVAHESFVRIRFSMYKTATRGLSMMLLVFFIASALLYYGSMRDSQEGFFLPQNVTDMAYGMVSGFMKSKYPGYQDDMTVDEFLVLSMAEKEGTSPEAQQLIEENTNKETGEIDVDALMADLPPETRNQVDEAKSELIAGLAGEENAEDVEGDMTMKDFVTNIMNESVANFIGPNEKLVPIIFAVVFFLILEIFNLIFYVIASALALLIYVVLKSAKFVKIGTERKDVDKLEI